MTVTDIHSKRRDTAHCGKIAERVDKAVDVYAYAIANHDDDPDLLLHLQGIVNERRDHLSKQEKEYGL
jgi:hypothetical protein